MIHASYTDFRKNLAGYMDRANDDRDAVLITRQGKEPCVMIAQSEWEGMLETMHLTRDPANSARLAESIAQADRGEIIHVEWNEAIQAFKPL